MATRDFPIVGDSLALGYRFQRHWDNSMATAFFFGELGAGLFLIGALYGSLVTMIVGVATTAILKTYFHMAHMGVPGRAWRAMIRPDRSWISRGFISIVVFTGAALLNILLNGFGLTEVLGGGAAVSGFAWLMKVLSIAAALFVMTYHGFAIADSSAISFWNTGLMPVSSVAYSTLSGVVVALSLDPAATAAGNFLLPSAHGAALIMLVVTTLVLLAMLNTANRGSPGARKSLRLLMPGGPYAKWFFGLVVAVGLVLPFVLLMLPEPDRLFHLIAAFSVLAGYFTFRVLVFKIGLYDPLISFAPET